MQRKEAIPSKTRLLHTPSIQTLTELVVVTPSFQHRHLPSVLHVSSWQAARVTWGEKAKQDSSNTELATEAHRSSTTLEQLDLVSCSLLVLLVLKRLAPESNVVGYLTKMSTI